MCTKVCDSGATLHSLSNSRCALSLGSAPWVPVHLFCLNSVLVSLLAWLHPAHLQLLLCLKDGLCFSSRGDGSRMHSYLKYGISEELGDCVEAF